jgi:hypothetical protein
MGTATSEYVGLGWDEARLISPLKATWGQVLT